MQIFGYVVEVRRQAGTAVAPTHSLSSTWKATHRHRKGGEYRQLHIGCLEADRSAVIIYDDREGQVWVRPSHEFHDGRFTAIAQ